MQDNHDWEELPDKGIHLQCRRCCKQMFFTKAAWAEICEAQSFDVIETARELYEGIITGSCK